MDEVDKILSQWRKSRPDLDLAPMGLVGRISRVSNLFASEMAGTFEKHDLNAAGFDVLATLRRSGPPYALSAGELMRSMMITSGSMTNRIQRLEKTGLIERTVDPEDARKASVKLTKQGFEVIEKAVVGHVATQAGLISGLSEEEMKSLEHLLRKLEALYHERNEPAQ